MFERYTEKARRIIFFARYEASQFGSPYIETEHLLLGVIREDKALSARFILKYISAESIRLKIETASTKREKIATSVDLPLSNEAKRVLAYAAEEAERLSHRHIGPEHLFLGLMREKGSFAAQILAEIGLKIETVREELAKAPASSDIPDSAALSPVRRDLNALAAEGKLNMFVGREKEMLRLVQVLGRSTRNNAALIGGPGSGKRAMVEGLAQKIGEGSLPAFAENRALLEFDVAQFGGRTLWSQSSELLTGNRTILFVEDLIPILASTHPMKLPPSIEILKTLVWSGKIQCICSATGDQYRTARQQHSWVDRCFSAIEIRPMTEAEAVSVLQSAKARLEMFHGVMFEPSLLSDAVNYSTRFISDRFLPGTALDLLDEAAAHALAGHRAAAPDEVRETQKRIRFIVQRMENAIRNHEFEKARFYSDEERKEREGMRALLEKYKLNEAFQVTRKDLEEVLAQWTGISVDEVCKKISSGGEGPAKS